MLYLAIINMNGKQAGTQVDRWWWCQPKNVGAVYSWNNSGPKTAKSRTQVLKNSCEWQKHKPFILAKYPPMTNQLQETWGWAAYALYCWQNVHQVGRWPYLID